MILTPGKLNPSQTRKLTPVVPEGGERPEMPVLSINASSVRLLANFGSQAKPMPTVCGPAIVKKPRKKQLPTTIRLETKDDVGLKYRQSLLS